MLRSEQREWGSPKATSRTLGLPDVIVLGLSMLGSPFQGESSKQTALPSISLCPGGYQRSSARPWGVLLDSPSPCNLPRFLDNALSWV